MQQMALAGRPLRRCCVPCLGRSARRLGRRSVVEKGAPEILTVVPVVVGPVARLGPLVLLVVVVAASFDYIKYVLVHVV